MEIPGYVIEQELGRGGMAVVYLAKQVALGREVAIKVMAPALAADKNFTERFLKEGQIIAQLDHPNIVRVIDLGKYNEIYYLSMEYLSGGTLEQRIEQRLSTEDTLSIVIDIAKALGYAHHQGVVHRDIKSQNILFRKNGLPVLTDFGIARFMDGNIQLTAPGLAMGSPQFMSPERVAGKKTDARSDLYSLGILFYQMLTGQMPYDGEDAVAVIMKQCTAPLPVLPKEFRRLQPILDKLLAKKPDDRFKNTEALIQALQTFEAKSSRKVTETELVSNIPTQLALPTLAKPAWLTGPFLWKGAAVSVILAVLGGGVYWAANDHPSEASPEINGNPNVLDSPNPAEQLFSEAKKLYDAGNYQKCLALTEQIALIKPNYPGLNDLKTQAEASWNEQKTQESKHRTIEGLLAERTFESLLKVQDLEPDNEKIKTELQKISQEKYQQAQQLFEQGKLQESRVIIDEFLRFSINYSGVSELQNQIETKNEINTLLGRAEQQVRDKKFIEPASDNAFDSYRAILEKEDNFKAWQGIDNIAKNYHQQLVIRLFDQNNFSDSSNLIERGLKKYPSFEGLQKLIRFARISKLENQAKENINQGKLDEASEIYKKILTIDKKNDEAHIGLQEITDKYKDQAEQLLAEGNSQQAILIIQKGLSIVSHHNGLLSLSEKIKKKSSEPSLLTPPKRQPVAITPPKPPTPRQPVAITPPKSPKIETAEIPPSAQPTHHPEPTNQPPIVNPGHTMTQRGVNF